MRKKLLVIILIFVLILTNYANISLGFIKKDYDKDEIIVINWAAESSDKILSDLKEQLGYEGTSLKKEMKLKTSIEITKSYKTKFLKKNKYKIRFRKE